MLAHQPLQLELAYGPRRAARARRGAAGAQQPLELLGHRHAHRLARGVWSDHWDANGRPQPPLGNLSAQQAQIVRLLPAERRLGAGDALQLHCQYDGRDSKTVTTLGLDERRQEMCNQYLVGETSLAVRCEGDAAVRHAAISAFCGTLPMPNGAVRPRVLLLSSKYNASGTNLQCANHVVFVEPPGTNARWCASGA